jgi:hypothetical protein
LCPNLAPLVAITIEDKSERIEHAPHEPPDVSGEFSLAERRLVEFFEKYGIT